MIILPYPKEIEELEGKLKYTAFNTECDDAEVKALFKDFSDANADCTIKLSKDLSLAEEEYKLEIGESGISIEYSKPVGAYRALTTLKLIISQSENSEIGFVKIHDYPSLKNRGYMLDISRGRIASLSHIKKIVDMMAELKYNQLQLYMESIVYEYKNFPQYWKDTKPLTQAEIREIDKYCAERFISLVPNQNGFGHMGAWTEKEELSHLAITGNDGKPSATLNPLKEESLELVDKIYDGYFDAFSSDIVNIGMDEPNELGLNETKEECDKRGVGAVFTDYLKKVCNLISNKYKKTPMFWDDIVFLHPEQLDNLPKEAVLMHWGYEAPHRFDRNCSMIKERGLKFYVCPGTSMWQSFTGRTNNAIANMRSAAAAAESYGAEGFLLTEWGDFGHPQMPAVTYFPFVYGAAISWTPGHIADYTLMDLIKGYMDKYIYKTENDKSLADIVCRMGNFYLLEEHLKGNTTETFYYMLMSEYIHTTDSLKVTERKKEGFRRVYKYMTEIREELNAVNADADMLEDIIFSCDLVIFISRLMCGIHDGIEEEKNDIINRYKALWVKTSHDIGQDIFINLLEKAFENYTK